MLTITEYEAEKVKDPFRILQGTRYEFKLDIEVPDDDELYTENGLYVRVIYKVDEDQSAIVKYEIYEKTTGQYLDFDLEEDEVELLENFCRDHLDEVDE
ncbi:MULTISPECIES: DUF6509 family protein [Paenibacillus]|jgi:hypothetical protein|uniref:DUF6509 family protein n=1 Tax=Paenibacillus TaxID=44249 RepID=UPI000CF852AA|nr:MULTISPECIES: DUF6509 family protein [Paenibacillus]MBJ9992827.1 pullulanase [Paenibacillus sp. S28]MEC0178276.1 DUF6509 family protein [Paenibacillus favisporus]PQP85839.1 pullulanase [Paenibacillus sp. AR247]GIO63834.1 hypothetical protein J43TS9_54080 [Paenibacillus cineris]